MASERKFRGSEGPINGTLVVLSADRQSVWFGGLTSDSAIQGEGYLAFDTSAGIIRFNDDGTAVWGREKYRLDEIVEEVTS